MVCLDGVKPEPTLSPNEWPQDTVFSASESNPDAQSTEQLADQRMWQLTHSRASNGHELPKETSSRMPSMILWAHFKQEASQVMYERQWQPGFSSSPCTLEQLVTSGWQTQNRIRRPCLVLGDSGMWDVKLNSVSVAQDVKLISVLSLEHLIFEFKGYEPKT